MEGDSKIQASRSLEFSQDYDRLERDREANDVMYAIFFGSDEHVDQYIPNLSKMVLDLYSKDLSAEGRHAIENVGRMDRAAKHSFILMGLYAFPPFLSYFLQNTDKSPKIANRDAFRHFVENIIGGAIENMLNGLAGMDIDKMVYYLRPEYVFTVGYYRPKDPVLRPEELLETPPKEGR